MKNLQTQDELPRVLAQALSQKGPAGLFLASAKALAYFRPMDIQNAQAVIKKYSIPTNFLKQKTDTQSSLNWLSNEIKRLAQSPSCLGCGQCCQTSSPTLLKKDLKAIKDQGISQTDLYTLRKGERVYSQRDKKGFVLENDLIKFKETPKGCLYLNENFECDIYKNRPWQCRHLKCWSESPEADFQENPPMTRQDLYSSDSTALALIEEFDHKICAEKIESLLSKAQNGQQDTFPFILEFINLDQRIRLGISQTYGFDKNELSLMLGRSIMELLPLYGLKFSLPQNEQATA